MTTFGTNGKHLTQPGLASLDAYSLFESFARLSMSCQSYLVKIAQEKTPDATAMALSQLAAAFRSLFWISTTMEKLMFGRYILDLDYIKFVHVKPIAIDQAMR